MSRIWLRLFGCGVLAFLLAGPGCGEAPGRISGFNRRKDLDLFERSGTSFELSTEHATEGGKCLKVTFTGQTTEWPGLSTKSPDVLKGWEKYEVFSADVFNPGNEPVSINVRIDDDRTDPDEWTSWYTAVWKALPGPNHFEIELKALITPRVKREINTERLTHFAVFLDYRRRKKDELTVLYFDDFLLKAKETVRFPEGLKAFDFGPAKSKTWPGFTGVTKDGGYSDDTGFGFRGTPALEERDYKLPDDIGRDTLRDNSPETTFSVKLRSGKYRVWAVLGDLGVHDWPPKPYTVSAEGKEVFSFTPKSETYLGSLDYTRDFSRRKTLWDLYAADRFQDVEFEANCADGILDVAFAPGGNVRLCALAVWPAGDGDSAKAIAEVKRARREQFNTRFREMKPAKLPPPPKPTKEEESLGFLLAHRNYLEEITPYFVPKAEDRLRKLSLAACPGEYEPAAFIIYPIRDRKAVRVEVSDLTGAQGTIPASRTRIERVVSRCSARTLDSYIIRAGQLDGAFSVYPVHLVPRSSVELEKGLPRQLWLTVHVPDDAAAGKYTGAVTVATDDSRSVRVPFELEVYPFTLETPPVTYAHVYYVRGDSERIEEDLRCLVEHGFNTVTGSIPNGPVKRVNGKLEVNFGPADQLMEVMKKVGMTGPVPLFNTSIQGWAGGASRTHLGFERAFGYKTTDPEYLDDLTELTRLILAHAKEKDWLPIIMYPSTEISNDAHLGPEFQRKLVQAIRKAGEVVCVASVNRPRDVPSVKDLDIIMYNAAVPINEETVRAAHDAACELWFQNIGGTRFNEGLFLLRTGAVGRRQWVLNGHVADPYNDFQYEPWDLRLASNSASLIFPSPEGTLPSVRLEWMREGVDDYRYFYTLKRLLEKAERTGKAGELAREARRAYDEMIASCPITMDRSLPVGRDGFAVNEGFRDKDTFDRYRRRVAAYIIRLKQALAE